MPRVKWRANKQRGQDVPVGDMTIEEMATELKWWRDQPNSFHRLFRTDKLREEVGIRWQAAIAGGRPEPSVLQRWGKILDAADMERRIQIAEKRTENDGKLRTI